MISNANCDACNANVRNRMDMRRPQPSMYDRYARGQMINRGQKSCEECSENREGLMNLPLAMAYVPWQKFGCTYEASEGLRAGTIFPDLDKPFYGRRGYR